ARTGIRSYASCSRRMASASRRRSIQSASASWMTRARERLSARRSRSTPASRLSSTLIATIFDIRSVYRSCSRPAIRRLREQSLLSAGREPGDSLRRRRGQLVEDVVERAREVPAGVVGFQPAQVTDVADVIADAVLVDVLERQLLPDPLLELGHRFEHRDAVVAAAAEVVDRRDARILVEGQECRADVVGVDVVAHLLALVPVHPVGPAVADALGEVREKAVQLGARVIRAGETAAAVADRRHAEVAAVLL